MLLTWKLLRPIPTIIEISTACHWSNRIPIPFQRSPHGRHQLPQHRTRPEERLLWLRVRQKQFQPVG